MFHSSEFKGKYLLPWLDSYLKKKTLCNHYKPCLSTKDFLELWIYCSKRLYLEVECCKTFSCTSTEKKNSFSYAVKMQFQKGLITFIFLLNPLLIIWDENKIELFPKSVYQCFFSEKCRIVIWELGNDLDPK